STAAPARSQNENCAPTRWRSSTGCGEMGYSRRRARTPPKHIAHCADRPKVLHARSSEVEVSPGHHRTTSRLIWTLARGASWNRTSGLILISVSASVVTIDAPYLLLCGMECSHNSVKDVVTTPATR